ncbi:MAG: glycosyltransferase [Burkholderiales bacterium]|nr:glycosyltransferase [Burkholderiales bacterium]
MRILHVVETLEVGGLERVVVALSAEQVRRGDTVTIACLFHEGPLAGDARAAGVEVISCDKRPGADGGALRRLRYALRSRSPQVLHTHNPTAHYYGVFAALGLRGMRRISTRHGMGSFRASRRRERLYRLSMIATDSAVAVCQAARERFVTRGVMPRGRSEVVVNGVDLARFAARDPARRDALVRDLGLGDTASLFGSVGRLNEAKDPSNLVDAFARTVAAHPRAALVIVGDGELRAAVEARVRGHGIGDRVRLLGTRADVPALLASFDAFVLASGTEGYSLALVEAAAAALPAVATDVGGNREIVSDGRTGLIVPPADPAALAAAMIALAGDPERREALGTAARRWALTHGSLGAMADAYGRLCRGEATDPAPEAAARGSAPRVDDGGVAS